MVDAVNTGSKEIDGALQPQLRTLHTQTQGSQEAHVTHDKPAISLDDAFPVPARLNNGQFNSAGLARLHFWIFRLMEIFRVSTFGASALLLDRT